MFRFCAVLAVLLVLGGPLSTGMLADETGGNQDTSENSEPAEVMTEKSALSWTLVFAAAIAMAHVISPYARSVIESNEASFGSFGGGMAAGYVFLHLFAELDEGHEVLGDRIHLFVLAGFLVYYGVEFYLQRRRRREPSSNRAAGFHIEIGLAWVYSWLMVYSLPDQLSEGGLAILPVIAALMLHLCFADAHMGKTHQQRFDRIGRFVLASAPLMGWVTDLFFFSDNPLVSDVLTALMAGSVVYKLFIHELPEGENSSFGWFLAGTTVFVTLDLLARGA